MPPNGFNLTITNPLVLYRSLLATNRIQPDPAQHRLTLHLQKLYERLIDYEPSIEYSERLKQLSRTLSTTQKGPPAITKKSRIGTKGIWTSLLAQKEKRDSLALTRVLTSHEAALNLQSPKGLMLHGEVGTGKSMLIDLFADGLPNRKKRRWHFNTFMLETFSRLEQIRRSPSKPPVQDEYTLLTLARDLIQTSPIIFLDEFQLPDRAASKILSNLMTSFFQFGGVLIATSNRMPEELAKAAGIEFSRPVGRLSRLGGVVGRDDGPGQKGEFAMFLEVLRGRCEIWEMEGKKDYRRLAGESDGIVEKREGKGTTKVSTSTSKGNGEVLTEPATRSETTLPKHYLITPAPTASPSDLIAHSIFLSTTLHNLTSTPPDQPIPWTPTTLTVYGRPLLISTQHNGTALFTFAQLCGTPLGPADYITLASTYHTICITDVPILGFLQKNEARRFITLLDAMYEARCRLLVTAAADPDSIFFPTAPSSSHSLTPENDEEIRGQTNPDSLYPETFSEIHQDLTSPFRPNISSYTTTTTSSSSLPLDALEDDPPNRIRRPNSSSTDQRSSVKAPDFSNMGVLTGEDEKFAVKRAESRIWEMCSGRWWERADAASAFSLGSVEGEGWWRPLPREMRHWERAASTAAAAAVNSSRTENIEKGEAVEGGRGDGNVKTGELRPEEMFAHDASPFRTASDAPPKIQWTHVWGTVKWGKRAGAWGKGVEGLEERRREKEGSLNKGGDEKK
ncbi:hypothetical protein CC80DRAFT_523372 [Byssothecium circinans]|uniref:AAA+ ATPase domain-containing protein n=1 Tax=Byssothecium circinans TaxID=147558 RepID=A0A6A5U5V7_9PLEO|nr:hypothetical protein CC80DRAFT_523372 [Byssothecium circinans]